MWSGTFEHNYMEKPHTENLEEEVLKNEDHKRPTIVIFNIIGHAHLMISFASSFISLAFKKPVNYEKIISFSRPLW